MRSRCFSVIPLLCIYVLAQGGAFAKDGIQATVDTTIPAGRDAGTELEISWTLADAKSGHPFNANRVFIRLIGATGDQTEAFARYGAHPDGRYSAIVAVPDGGVSEIQIGVAGRLTRPDGSKVRSDWLMDLANDPLVH
jgi:hypothetical protein